MHFTREQRLGDGTFGPAWRARVGETGAEVVLKPLPGAAFGDPRRRAGLWRSVFLARQVASPYVARPIEVYALEDGPFLAREFVPGTPASEILRASGPFDWPTVQKVIRQVAAGLAPIHSVGLWHLDLRPSNVIVDDSGTARLTDYGLAAVLPEMTEPARKAPGGTDARSDLYELGLLAYELLTGSLPASGPIAPPGSPAGPAPGSGPERLPVEARPLIAWLLAPRPAKRPQSALQLMAAMDGFAPIPTAAAPTAIPSEVEITIRPRSVLVALAAIGAVIVLLVGAAGVIMTSARPVAPEPWSFEPWTPAVPGPPTSEPIETPSPGPSLPGPTEPIVTLPPTTTARFLARIKSDSFQFKATVTGIIRNGDQPDTRVSGTISMKGNDSTLHLQAHEGDPSPSWGINDSIFVGDTRYDLCDPQGGKWCPTYREANLADSYLAWFRSIPSLVDEGVVTWHGKNAHALRASWVDTGAGTLLELGGPLSSCETILIESMVGDDGTPVGMVIDATWDFQESPGYGLKLDYVFDALSGVKISPPPTLYG
jgi:serine/threonine protein kinase